MCIDNTNVLLGGLSSLIDTYYNYTGDKICYISPNISSFGSAFIDNAEISLAWGYLYCTEILLVSGQDGINDMFWNEPWNQTATSNYCFQQYTKKKIIKSKI